MLYNHKKNIFYFLFIIFLSILTYEGIQGGDHSQVSKFIYNFNSYSGSFSNFFTNEMKFELSHRYIWIIHDSIIFYLIQLFLNSETHIFKFIFNYTTGLLLAIYTFLSLLIMYKIFRSNSSNINSSIFCFAIFFGTPLICLFTGFIQESMIVLLFTLSYLLRGTKYEFLCDLIIISIKPFYFLVIVGKILAKYDLFNEIKFKFYYLSLLITSWFLIKMIFTGLGDGIILNYEFYLRASDFQDVISNLCNIYFSLSFGLIFTFSLPIFFIIVGWSGNKTFIKLFFFILLSLFIATVPYWHGHMAGNRYLAPAFLIFFPEFIKFIRVFDKYSKLKKKLILLTTIMLICINLPQLEYRNTSIYDYVRSSAFAGEASASRYGMEDINKYYSNQIYNIGFHPTIFSFKIFYSKLTNKDFLFSKEKVEINDVYPATGIGRLIYVHENNLQDIYSLPLTLSNNFILFLKFIYYFFYLFIPTSFILLLGKKIIQLK